MTTEDIIRMAQEAGFRVNTTEAFLEELKRFSTLVASAEREECAKAVENYCGAWDDQGYALANTIRARGQA